MANRIERIELWHLNVPLPAPFWPWWIPGYTQTHIAQTVARFCTGDGLVAKTGGPAFTTERRGLGELLGGFLFGMRKRLREASCLEWRNWWLEAGLTLKKAKDAAQG